MTHYRPKVYTASKISYASLWRQLRNEEWKHLDFTARWIDIEDLELEERISGPAEYVHFWTIDIQDVRRSDFVLIYARPGDLLKGALVEVGAALALGKIVLSVGIDPSHTWSYHPCVVRLDTLSQANDFLKRYTLRKDLQDDVARP
jgi:nucleoside 2-deoxyribosyltransferase